MQPFGFATAGRIVFGRGQFVEAAEMAASLGRRVFLVHGASGRHIAPFLEAGKARGLVVTCHACPAEPDLSLLAEALTVARNRGTECVVAIGGGAALDLGKAVAALLPAPGDPIDHLEVVGKGLPLERQPLPCLAVPTTAGTGAEVTRNAVIGVPEHGRKVSLRDARLIPDIALVDPALTDGAPRAVTLGSGLDAVTQVIEPYLSTRATPLTDAICRSAIPKGLKALARLMATEDPDARDDLAYTSLCGGLALANAGLGAVHGLAGVIGGAVPTAPHGAVCGVLLPHVLAANRIACNDKTRFDEVDAAIRAALGTSDLARWASDQGLPSLSAMGVTPKMHADIAEAALASSSMKANPAELPVGRLQEILAAAG